MIEKVAIDNVTGERVPSVLQRIQELRAELAEIPIAKSGDNKFAGYKYFELKDFLPHLTKLLVKYRLTKVLRVLPDRVVLEVWDWNSDDMVEFSVTRAASEVYKGMKPIQSLGADVTYYRRYLDSLLVDLVEDDAVDALPQQEQRTAKNQTNKEEDLF